MMEFTDILLIAILAAILRPQIMASDWMKSRRRNVMRNFRAWREKRKGNDGK